jgi:4'-phosphopantetheinyl transferase
MSAWQPLRGHYELPENEVHVWRATLDGASGRVAALRQLLSPEERARADRFHFVRDRTRFTIGRGLLRLLLGHCLGRPADQLTFDYSSFDKPSLPAGEPLQFNVSHSGASILVAMARRRVLGVDVEQIRADMATTRIAEEFFSTNESRALASLSSTLQCEAFFSCWTRKEAYIKAKGEGLSLPLAQFDVAFLPGEEPRLVETRPDPAEALRWTMRSLEPGAGYKGAIVAEGAGWTLRCWDWSGELIFTAPA